MPNLRVYEWWVTWEEVAEMLHKCIKETKTVTAYLIEKFHLDVPCKIILRPIVEEI